jgi:hypothetical protein
VLRKFLHRSGLPAKNAKDTMCEEEQRSAVGGQKTDDG